jgi:stearoyl-CoA desaturase (delta-9 desaturase)
MLALQDGAINWVATHRIHHQHTEIPGKDPHTPREGKWWSHAGWIFRGTAQQYRMMFCVVTRRICGKTLCIVS